MFYQTICFTVRRISEIIGNKENGYLFNSKYVNDLVMKLEDAIKMVLIEECQTIILNTQKRIITISNISTNAEQRLNLAGL